MTRVSCGPPGPQDTPRSSGPILQLEAMRLTCDPIEADPSARHPLASKPLPPTIVPLPPRLQRLADLVGGDTAFNRTIHVWPNPGFIYLSNPICACSTLKMSLNLSVAKYSDRPDFTIATAEDIHRRNANLLKTPRQMNHGVFQKMLDNPDVPIFTLVRDPVARFVSAWSKKLTYDNAFTAKVRAHLGVADDVPLADFLSLNQFAALVAEDSALRDLDEHWRLQRKQIFFDQITRTDFGRVESFAVDAPRLFGRIFGEGNFVLRDATALNPSNASGRKREAVDVLSQTARAQVIEAYKLDTEMLDEIKSRDAA